MNDDKGMNDQQGTLPLGSGQAVKPTVVGIGASAGGLAALKRLFDLMPPDTGLAFVVVVHLSPEHKSHLADILQLSVRFPVQQVNDTTPLQANHVYVIPPNANLSSIDSHLRLSKLEEARSERAPIDHFFRTLASSHDGHSIGVILTGTGSDGTLGLKDIKAKGGLVLVQDPNEAEYDGMPQSAIATGLVDRILPLDEMPEALARLAQVEPRVVLHEGEEDRTEQNRALLAKVLAVLKTRTERDFSRYKSATLLRRIARRMQLNYIEDIEQYIEKLRTLPEETRALADDLLVTVTSFFRDPEVFAHLAKQIIPQMFEGREPADTLRVWSVGCATGEEAYSLAILLLEEAARRESPPKLQIFASDLHKHSLDAARTGLYSGDIATDVGAERLKRFFRKENGGYRINKEVREIVTFAPHNLLGDPPFSRLHLITCRNLLIYLDRAAQKDVVDLFHYALSPNGYLLLGSAETVDASNLFRTEDKKVCLYRKRNVPPPEPRLPVFPLSRLPRNEKPDSKTQQLSGPVSSEAVHQNLLERYAPPSILIAPDDRLAHLSRSAGRYLVLPGGDATLNGVKVVRDELRVELHRLLQSARDTKQLIDSSPIPVRFNGHTAPVVMHVRPALDADQEGYVLVIFEEHQTLSESSASSTSISNADLEPEQAANRVVELEAELAEARQRLQTTIEEYETSREEMKASAEEMQSTNEELRSTMEELETSKEELQSINEELQTVNQENRHKVEELSQLTSDLQNLMAATDIATLFLDRDLRIVRFTPRLAELFNVRVTDRGRPISDLTHRLGYGQLREDAEAVLSRLIPSEREIGDDRGHWYLTRVLPYRSSEDHIQGVVITFIDITARKTAEAALRESEERYRLLFQASPAPFLIIKPDAPHFTIMEVNDAYLAATMRTREEVVGRGIFEAFPDNPNNATIGGVSTLCASIECVVASGQPDRLPVLRYDIARPDGSFEERWWSPVNSPVLDENGKVEAIIHNVNNVTQEHRAEAELRESEELRRIALESGGMGAWQWNTRERTVRADQFFQRQWGVSFVDQPHPVTVYTERMKPETAVSIEAVMARDIAPGEEFYGHVQVVSHDISGRWLEWRGRADRERPWVINGVSFDITERKLAEEAKREHQERQAFLLNLSDELKTLNNPVDVPGAAIRMLVEHLSLVRAAYYEVDADQDGMLLLTSLETDAIKWPKRMKMSDYGPDISGAYRAGQTYVVNDAETDPRLSEKGRAAIRDLGIRSLVGVPLLKGGNIVVVLGVHAREPRHWQDHELRLLEEVADRTWAAVEQTRAEAALRESEEKYHRVFESIDQGFCVLELVRGNDGQVENLVFRQVNGAFTAQTGLTDVIGKTIHETLPDYEQRWIETYLNVAETGESRRVEHYMHSLDRWYNVNFTALNGPGSSFVATVFDDVTGSKRAEITLRESAEYQAAELESLRRLHTLGMRSVTNDSFEGILREIVDTAIVIAHADFGNIQLLDPHSGDLQIAAQRGFPQWWIDYWQTNSKGHGVCGTALEVKQRVVVEDVLQSPIFTGTALQIQIDAGVRAVQSTPIVSRAGKILGMFSTHYKSQHRPGEQELQFLDLLARQAGDIIDHLRTAATLRASEAKYRTLFESIDEGLSVIEFVDDWSDLRYVEVNQAFERQTGLKNITGRLLSEVAPETELSWLETYRGIARTGEAKRFETYHQGTGRWYNAFATRVGGSVSRQVCIVFQDTTERRQKEENQQFLLKLSDAMRAETDGESIKQQTVTMVAEHLQLDRCYISEVFEPNGYSTVSAEHVGPGLAPMAGVYRLADYPEAVRQLVTERMEVDDASRDPRFSDSEKALLDGLQLRALLAVPLRKGESQLLWLLAGTQAVPRHWNDGERLLLEEVAERTWAAVERARAEAALRDSEELRRIALESGGMGTWRWDARGRSVRADEVFQRLWGVSSSDGPHPVSVYSDLMYPEGAAAIEAVMAKELTPGEEFDGQLQVAKGPAAGRWVRWRGRAAGNEPWIINGVSFDITEQTVSEQKLRESEEKYRALFNEMDEAYAVVDVLPDGAGGWSDFRFVEVNPAFMKHTAMPYPVGRTATELLGAPNPHWTKVYGRVAETGEAVRFEEAEPTLNRVFDLNVFRLGGPGSRRVAVLFRDITERKHQEIKQKLLMDVSEKLGRLTLDQKEIVRNAGEALVHHLDLTCYHYVDVNEDRAEVEVRHFWHALDVPPIVGTYPIAGFTTRRGLEAMRAGKTMVVNDTKAELRGDEPQVAAVAAGAAAQKIAAYVAVPFSENGRWKGYFAVADSKPRHWTSGDIELIQDVANRVLPRLERARAEAALRESEARYQALFAASPVPFIVVAPNAPDFTIIAANDAYVTATLGTREALIGRRLLDVFTYDPDRPGLQGSGAVARSLERVLATRRTDVMERLRYDIPTSDGELEPHWWLAVNAPMFDVDGNIIALIHQATRVTEQYYAEEAARENEERQAFLLRFSDALRPLVDTREIKAAATRAVSEWLGIASAGYAEVEADGRTAVITDEYNDGRVISLTARYTLSDFGSVTEAIGRGETVHFADLSDDGVSPDAQASFAAINVRSAVFIPLIKNGVMVAYFFVAHPESRIWARTDLEILRETAERTWAAVQRARAEAALRESEARLTAAFESVPVGIAVCNMSGEIILSNALYRRFVPGGLMPSRDPAKLRHWQGWDPQGRPIEPQEFPGARALRGETVVPGHEMLYTDGAGREIWTSVATVPIRDQGGRVTGLVTVVDDIDAVKRSADALRESEEQFRRAVEDAPIPVVMHAEDGQVLQISRAWTELTGFRPEDIPTFEAWLNHAYGEGAEVIRDHMRTLFAGIQRTVDIDFPIRTRTGERRHWSFSASSPGTLRDGRRFIVGMAVDITRRKRAEDALRKSEERFRLLVDNVQEYALFQVDSEGTATSWNPGAERLFGYTSSELLGRNVDVLLTPEDRQAGVFAREIANVRNGERPRDARWMVRKDGTRFWAQWVTEPVLDEVGELRGVVKVLRDETERKKAEERQLLMMGELNHRVKNTLATVQSMASQTLRGTSDPAQFVVNFQARLHALSRAHTLLTRRSWEAADVTDVVGDQLSMGGEGERVVIAGPPALLSPPSAVALALVIHELGTNARKYGALSSPSGRVSVEWTTTESEPLLTLNWRETGGPPVRPPEKRGFGTTLIEKSLGGVGGSTALRFETEGLRCTIRLPLAENGNLGSRHRSKDDRQTHSGHRG